MQPSSIKYLKEVDRMLLRSIISLKSDGGMTLEFILERKSLFAYPKPVPLIKELVDASTYNIKDATVLDFFAGFRVIIVIEANSYVNTRSSRLLPKFKTQKINSWGAV